MIPMRLTVIGCAGSYPGPDQKPVLILKNKPPLTSSLPMSTHPFTRSVATNTRTQGTVGLTVDLGLV